MALSCKVCWITFIHGRPCSRFLVYSLHADLEIYSTCITTWHHQIWHKKLNGQSTLKHCISQLASFLTTIHTQHVGRSVYSVYSATISAGCFVCWGCWQDSGSKMSHLRFVVQIWSKWSYKPIFAVWVHYDQQCNILKLGEKSSTFTGNMKHTVLGKMASWDQTYKW